jgi:hypothetical protein
MRQDNNFVEMIDMTLDVGTIASPIVFSETNDRNETRCRIPLFVFK